MTTATTRSSAVSTQDTITGDAGNDIIIGGPGDDNIKGGDGIDIIYGNAGNDTITRRTRGRHHRRWRWRRHITCGDGNDTVSGGIMGSSGNNDKITCDNGDNFIAGFSANDHLTGGTGNDTILGGAGAQHLCGGAGARGFDTIFCP